MKIVKFVWIGKIIAFASILGLLLAFERRPSNPILENFLTASDRSCRHRRYEFSRTRNQLLEKLKTWWPMLMSIAFR